LGSGKGASDALLFQNVPDLDNIRHFEETTPGELDVSIRAVGEILPNPQNTVTVPAQSGQADNDEFTVPRAMVTLAPRNSTSGGGNNLDVQVMALMDTVTDHLAQNLFGAGPQTGYQSAATQLADGLGTTYHESGTLRMGERPSQSVVDPDGQFHYV